MFLLPPHGNLQNYPAHHGTLQEAGSSKEQLDDSAPFRAKQR